MTIDADAGTGSTDSEIEPGDSSGIDGSGIDGGGMDNGTDDDIVVLPWWQSKVNLVSVLLAVLILALG
ncbi:MAG TPA: hypothetical protein VGM78_01595, partial [Ilumatobacteraceae bacterium]